MLHALLTRNGSTHAAGRGQESSIKALGFIMLEILILLNIMPYTWTKIIALVIGILLLLLILFFASN